MPWPSCARRCRATPTTWPACRGTRTPTTRPTGGVDPRTDRGRRPARGDLRARRSPGTDRAAVVRPPGAPAGSDVDQDEPWSIGAAGLDALLAETGRRFGKHPDDRSRILTAPVADGEVTLAVTVESGGPARWRRRGSWSTCRRRDDLVRETDGGQGPVFTDEVQFRRALGLGLRSSTPTPRSSLGPSNAAWSRWTCRRRTDPERCDRSRQTSSRNRSKTRAPNSRASTGTRSSMPWNSAVKSRSSAAGAGRSRRTACPA